jgi:hypothetical protein
MAAKHIGVKKLRRHTFLTGVDDLCSGSDGLDLSDVPGFDGITKNESHRIWVEVAWNESKPDRKMGELSTVLF